MATYKVIMGNNTPSVIKAESHKDAIQSCLAKSRQIVEVDRLHANACVQGKRVTKYYRVGEIPTKPKYHVFNNNQAQAIGNQIKRAYVGRSIGTTYSTKIFHDVNKHATYCVVMGWQDGFGENGEDYALCVKVGYVPDNSGMHEYDMDYLMPKCYETGDVDDTELSFEAEPSNKEIESALRWFDEALLRIRNGETGTWE